MSGTNMDRNRGAKLDKTPERQSDSGLGRHRSFIEQVKTNHEIGEPYGFTGHVRQDELTTLPPKPKIDEAAIQVADSEYDGKFYDRDDYNIVKSEFPQPGKLQRANTIGVKLGMLTLNNHDNTIDSTASQSKKKRPNDRERNETSAPKLAKITPFSSTAASRVFRHTNVKSQPNLRLFRNLSSTQAHQRQRSWHAPIIPANSTAIPEAERTPPLPPPQTESMPAQPPPSAYLSSQSRKNSTGSNNDNDNPHTSLVLQPDSRPMPEGQLAAEIKAIYSGLVMIEAKCINVVNAENERLKQNKDSKSPEWTALIALHRALLQEHHDFFLASQHPMSSDLLKGLANKYSMAARMWKHGIHSFLELLRHSLPSSMEYMQAFIILAYQMIALLYETVNSFKDTWIECLGDLARYRMAIEDDDPKDRDTYTVVSRSWYSKASRRNVNIGRLYHHQAILARTQPLKQLSLYARSLAAVQPFNSAKQSILTLFDPILSRINLPGSNSTSIDSRFMRLIAMRFTQRYLKEHYQSTLEQFLKNFNESIQQAQHNWKIIGEYLAVILLASILMWGEQKGVHRIFTRRESNTTSRRTSGVGVQNSEKEYGEHLSASRAFKSRLAPEWHLLREMLIIVLKRQDDENCLQFVYLIVCFLWGLSSVQYGPEYLDDAFPFKELSEYMNHLEDERKSVDSKSEPLEGVLLPEEQRMQGQAWAQKLFPPNPNPDTDGEEEDFQEPPSPLVPRAQKEKILRLGREIADKGATYTPMRRNWLSFNRSTGKFSAGGHRYLSDASAVDKVRDSNKVAVADLDHQMTGFEQV